MSAETREQLRQEIADAGGNEVLAQGWLDEEGLLIRLKVRARGDASSVLALGLESFDDDEEEPCHVFVHNHPSGFLSPSDADLRIAGRAGEAGIGCYIVDNPVSRIYVVAEPILGKKVKKLNPEKIRAALEEGGSIARRLPSYEKRQSQLDLMELIIRAFNDDALAACEAGTGVGKSFAYLLPAMRYALDNGERVVLSTATINLQQQLYEKDIPLVASALGRTIKAVMVKGRGNYLCLRRLEDALAEPGFEEEENETFAQLAQWAEGSPSGSRSDLSFMISEALWSRVCSEADLCMGIRCPRREKCFVFALRRECSAARILVVNHHLLFADLAARRQGAGYDSTVVLPPYRRVVIDEAHTIEGAATSFFSEGFSRLGIYRQLGRLYRRSRGRVSGLLPRFLDLVEGAGADTLDTLSDQISAARNKADDLDEAALELCGHEGVFRLNPHRHEELSSGIAPCLLALRKSLSALSGSIRELLEQLHEGAEDDPAVWEIRGIIRRLDSSASVCSAFLEYRERSEEVMWLERRRSRGDNSRKGGSRADYVNLTVTPLDVAPSLEEALFSPNKTVVCLSATLCVAPPRSRSWHDGDEDSDGAAPGPPADFRYWADRSGLSLVHDRTVLTGLFPSPFPYDQAVLLSCPANAPEPSSELYRDFVNHAVTALVSASGGSALVLFTSYESLIAAYGESRFALEEQGIRCLKQGDDDRARLLASFLEDEQSVLFATDSFWEGVDAPGDTLRLVIICRLPFRIPSDPVFSARCEALEGRGQNPFMELSLPEAVMKLKQGFGRLMRRSSDHGAVVILDPRLLRKFYGRAFLASLPPTKTCFEDLHTIARTVEKFLF